MQLQTGLGGNFALGAWPGSQGTATNPNPQGPTSVSEAAFGVTAGNGSMSGETSGTLLAGTIALVILVGMWWALPR